jgi:hypothetical protein
VSPITAELDDHDRRVIRCLLFGRSTLDLLCDSLELQCHQVRRSVDALEARGLIHAQGKGGLNELEFTLTEEGRDHALAGVSPDERELVDRRLSPDDVTYLRNLSSEQALARRAQCEWGVGATRQHLWEEGLIDVVGFIRPHSVLTDRGHEVVRTVSGDVA